MASQLSLITWVFAATAVTGCVDDTTGSDPSDSQAPEVIDSRSCSVDLVRGITDCEGVDGIKALVARPAAASLAAGCFQSLVNVDLSPGGKRARFTISYGSTVSGWSLNIGDSRTNNGFAGDGATQSRDAEMQIRENQMTVWGNDHTPSSVSRQFVTLDNLSLANSTIGLVVSNERLDWIKLSPYQDGYVSSPYLYALAGQSDTEGAVNYTIHAGFNRVVDDYSVGERYGCGVTGYQVAIETISTGGGGGGGGGGGCLKGASTNSLLPQC